MQKVIMPKLINGEKLLVSDQTVLEILKHFDRLQKRYKKLKPYQLFAEKNENDYYAVSIGWIVKTIYEVKRINKSETAKINSRSNAKYIKLTAEATQNIRKKQ